MTYAFSRDGAVPGSKWWASLSKNQVPVQAVILADRLAANDADRQIKIAHQTLDDLLEMGIRCIKIHPSHQLFPANAACRAGARAVRRAACGASQLKQT